MDITNMKEAIQIQILKIILEIMSLCDHALRNSRINLYLIYNKLIFEV